MQKKIVWHANLIVAKASKSVEKNKVFFCLLETTGRDNIGAGRDAKVLRRTSGGGATVTCFARTFIKSREPEKLSRELLRNGNS